MTRQKTTSVVRRIAIAVTLATLAATVQWTTADASARVSGATAPIVGMNDAGRVPGRYLVQLREGFRTGTDAGRVSRAHGGALRGLYRDVGSFLFGGSAGDAAALAQDARVLRIEADRKVELTGTDHVLDKNPDAIRRLRVRYTHSSNCIEVPTTTCIGITGAGVRMAIIDTGVDQDHPEFRHTNGAASATRIANDRANCNSSAVLTQTSTGQDIADDGNGHGTRNAGNAAAGGLNIYGVAPAATIVPVKVALKVSAITCGINYLTALNNDATATNDVRVVSLSLIWGDGGTADACASAAVSGQAICNLYNSLETNKVFITAAAGNGAKNVSSVAPGKWNQANAISAECERSPFGHPGTPDGLGTFSNYGSQIDFASPGCNVFSTEDGEGAANYKTSSGTSRSSPYLAGIATLLIHAKPTITAAEIKTSLQVGGMCPDNTFNTDGGNCNSGQGQWPRVNYKSLAIASTPDKDGIAEPLPIAYDSVCAVVPPPVGCL